MSRWNQFQLSVATHRGMITQDKLAEATRLALFRLLRACAALAMTLGRP